jgi:ABC-2 type transport system ATP-binding protein
MSLIEVEGLSRTFKSLTAVDNISFTVDAGEIFGFLGQNGAGKTTTIRMLTAQLRPTAGRARVAGCDVVKDVQRLKPLIGVVPEYQNLYERMSARENLVFAAQLYGQDERRINDVLDQVGLIDRAKERVAHFSNGMKQRLLLARALLHRPQVLFLDEPTKGLDPVVAADIRRLILDLSGQGVTTFLTTHYLKEADELCKRVAFINQGKIVALDTPANFKITHGERHLRVILNNGQSLDVDLNDPEAGIRIGQLVTSGQVRSVHSAEATLEEVFIKLTE